MAKQNKNYRIDGRISRLLKPIFQIKEFQATMEFTWKPQDMNIRIVIFKSYKYKKYSIALDPSNMHTKEFMDEFGVSVEGWDTWKKTVETFIEVVKDNFWRDYENEVNETYDTDKGEKNNDK